MKRVQMGLVVAVAAAALILPAGAIAGKGGEHGGKAKGHRPHDVAYVFKGLYAGEGSVDVKRGNSRVRKGEFIGQTVAFDLEGSRIVVADVNGDGSRNLEDVAEGDWVLVKAMLPRTDPGDQPFAALRLIDKTSFRK